MCECVFFCHFHKAARVRIYCSRPHRDDRLILVLTLRNGSENLTNIYFLLFIHKS